MSGTGETPGTPGKPTSRLIDIKLDQSVSGRSSSNIDHEREVAIYDILDANTFALEGRDEGPYRLTVGIVEDRLVLSVGNERTDILVTHVLSLSPIRRLMKDYFIVCESYYAAIRSAPPSRIQSIDMGRRALHDEGSRLLIERLKGKIEMDRDTARRMFTLICALHWKG
jgi:uncharacterized protein (UPF0262 family)